MHKLRSLDDLHSLIKNRIQEDLHLEYKASPAIADSQRGEIAKDVSAFANSDGGVLVYGVVEKDQYPLRIDEGVDAQTFNREWLENVITSNVSPRLDGVVIHAIEIAPDRCAYVVEVPKSYRGPHQERKSKRYHKRFNFKSEPMEDYEINDVRNRRDLVMPLVSVDIDIYHGALIHLVIANVGDIPAEDVRFEITPEMPKELSRLTPNLITEGCAFLSPKREYRFYVGSAVEHLHKDALHTFDVAVSYFNRRVGSRIADTFHFDLLDYLHTAIIASDVRDHGEKLVKAIGDLKDEVSRVKEALQEIVPIAGPTGLNLSFSAIRNFQSLRDGERTIERINPYTCPAEAFCEVLGVDTRMSHLLHHYFRYRRSFSHTVEGVSGVTAELVDKLKIFFSVDTDDLPTSSLTGES